MLLAAAADPRRPRPWPNAWPQPSPPSAPALPDLRLTVDPVEFRGLRYHTGVTLTVFAPGRHEELARGGRYICGNGERASRPPA